MSWCYTTLSMPMLLKQTVKATDDAAAMTHRMAAAVHQQAVRRQQVPYPEGQGQ